MPSSRKVDANGFVMIKGCPLSSYGIFDYSAQQVGLDGDPHRIVKVFRPEEALTDLETIQSLKDLPLINDHAMLSGLAGDEEYTAPEDYGVDGVLTSNVYWEAPWLRGDLRIFSRSMQMALDAGKKDLSLGYSCDFTHTPGVWKGQPYEVVQTNMRGNHIALVGAGRVSGARVLDGLCFDHLSFELVNSKEEKDMPKPVKKAVQDGAVEDLKAALANLMPTLQAFVSEGQGDPQQNAEPQNQQEATQPAENDDGQDNLASSIEGEGQANIAGAEEGGEGTQEPGSEQGAQGVDLPGLISQIENVLGALKAASGEPSIEQNDQTQDGTEGIQENANANDSEVPSSEEKPATDAEGSSGIEGPAAGTEEKPAVTAKAEDAALGRFYADLARKDRNYNRLSSVVGAFDHKAMDAAGVCAYGVKKLKLNCAAGQEELVLNAYLDGHDATLKQQNTRRQTAADSAVKSSAELDEYLQGSK